MFTHITLDDTSDASDWNLSGRHNSYASRFPNYLTRDQCPDHQSVVFVVLASVSIVITVVLFLVFALAYVPPLVSLV